MSINPGILKFRSNSECDTRRIAGLTARAIELAFNPAKGGAIFFLNGTLGAGKTFFVQALLTELGVAQEIVSPTFSICIPYRANGLDVWHMDAYRIEHDEEIEELKNRSSLRKPSRVSIFGQI
jgi:tRNA threonylcarbamoyl adenosine modification protein YjeE